MTAKASRPALILIGGFAGTGKTSLSRRLAADLGVPRLSSDDLIQMIRSSLGMTDAAASAGWVAYEVLFGLGEEFLRAGVSTIVDTNLGWAFQWETLDALRERQPGILFVPIVLRCPWEICLERIRRRYEADPSPGDPPERYMTEPKIQAVWEFLEGLDRPDAHFVDASRPRDEVYREVRQYVTSLIDVAGSVPPMRRPAMFTSGDLGPTRVRDE